MRHIPGRLDLEALALLHCAPEKPVGVCHNCWTTWRARQPRPAAVYCHHFGNAARLAPDGWRVFEAIGAKALAGMRGDL